MRFTLHWGLSNSARIHTVDDLDTLLALLATVPGQHGAAHAVDLLPAGAVDGGLRFGVGHPHRAFILALDAVGGYTVQPDLEPWPEPIAFDCGHDVLDYKPAWPASPPPPPSPRRARTYRRPAVGPALRPERVTPSHVPGGTATGR